MEEIMKSILGYAKGSPYAGNPFLDIQTPEGLIDMSNTPIDLIGIDNLGNKKKMKAGAKNPYKFPGTVVREIPTGNPFSQGGMTPAQMYAFLFDDDEEETTKVIPPVTAPTVVDVEQQQMEQPNFDEEEENASMEIALQNLYGRSQQRRAPSNMDVGVPLGVNPYLAQAQGDLMDQYELTNLGIWGDKSHQARKSDHNTGDAQDFGFKDEGNAIAAVAQLQREAKERNVKYIIYNGRIWNPSISNEWRPYKGSNPHKSHFHVSYNR